MSAQPINYKALIPDFGVYSPYSPLIVAVEFEFNPEATAAYAAEYRQILLDDEFTPPHAPYLLMPSMKEVFLWRRETARGALPDYVAPATPVLQHYAPVLSYDGTWWSRNAITVPFRRWLNALVTMQRVPAYDFEPDRILVESGVYEQIHHGQLRIKEED